MRFENTTRDILVVCDDKGAAQVVVPGTGFRSSGVLPDKLPEGVKRDPNVKMGDYYVGELVIEDDKLPGMMGDLSKLIHSGRLKAAPHDIAALEASGLLHPKQA